MGALPGSDIVPESDLGPRVAKPLRDSPDPPEAWVI